MNHESQLPPMPPSAVHVDTYHFDDLSQLSDDVPAWLTRLRVPARWRVGRLEGVKQQPWRISVCEPHGAGWDACETVAVYGFTGFPTTDLIRRNSEQTLRSLEAGPLATVMLATPRVEGEFSMRSSGYLRIGCREIWTQYTFYVAGSDVPFQGRLVQQCVFVESSRETALKDDIAHLSDAMHNGFIAAINGRQY